MDFWNRIGIGGHRPVEIGNNEDGFDGCRGATTSDELFKIYSGSDKREADSRQTKKIDFNHRVREFDLFRTGEFFTFQVPKEKK
jgi:hypothetical protein